jgi:hypothetical protein
MQANTTGVYNSTSGDQMSAWTPHPVFSTMKNHMFIDVAGQKNWDAFARTEILIIFMFIY